MSAGAGVAGWCGREHGEVREERLSGAHRALHEARRHAHVHVGAVVARCRAERGKGPVMIERVVVFGVRMAVDGAGPLGPPPGDVARDPAFRDSRSGICRRARCDSRAIAAASRSCRPPHRGGTRCRSRRSHRRYCARRCCARTDPAGGSCATGSTASRSRSCCRTSRLDAATSALTSGSHCVSAVSRSSVSTKRMLRWAVPAACAGAAASGNGREQGEGGQDHPKGSERWLGPEPRGARRARSSSRPELYDARLADLRAGRRRNGSLMHESLTAR